MVTKVVFYFGTELVVLEEIFCHCLRNWGFNTKRMWGEALEFDESESLFEVFIKAVVFIPLKGSLEL